MATTMLKVSGLKVAYGGIQAVKGVSFEVNEGELVSLIGANGAGKTTTLKAITGTQPAASGEIQFMGRSIKGQGPWDLVKQGLVMVPEGRGTFTRMTITENLQMGAFIREDNEVEADIEKVFAIFPRLKERRNQLAGTMSGGEQQMLAMGRALMAKPKVLLLDEPSMGLSPIMVERIFDVVRNVGSGDAFDAGDKLEVLSDLKRVVQRRHLRQISQPFCRFLVLGRHVEPGDRDRAGARSGKSGDHAHGGGLAGTVGSEKSDDFAFLHRKSQIVNNGLCAESF